MPTIASQNLNHDKAIPHDRLLGKAKARVIAVSSGKGGVGKSSISLSLAVELSLQHNKVCIFDADTNLANINIMTGLNPVSTLHDFITGNVSIEDLLVEGPSGISIIPAASGLMELISFNAVQQHSLIRLVQHLESHFDYILIDTSAGINETVLGFLHAAAHRIIVITPEPTSLTDAFSLLKVLKKQGFDFPVQVLVNKVKTFEEAKEVLLRFASAVRKYLKLRIVVPGYIYEDSNVPRSIMAQKPFSVLYSRSPASCCVRNIATKLKSNSSSEEAVFSTYLAKDMNLLAFDVGNNTKEIKPWMLQAIASLKSASVDEAEQFLELMSQQWIAKLEEKSSDDKYFNSSGYRTAIQFASKLRC